MKFVAIVAIGMICLGAMLMILALAGALGSWLWGASAGLGEDRPATKGLAGGRWFHWLLVCGVVVFILAGCVLLVAEAWRCGSTAGRFYYPWLLLLSGLLLVLLAIGVRCGIAAAARHSVWVFILAVTAAMLLPVGGPISDKAWQATCRSNLKQVGLMLLMYAEDYDDKLPPSDSWLEAVGPYTYTEEILVCPLTRKKYIFNHALGAKDVNEIDNLAEVPVAWDARADNGRPPHNGSFNVCFLDGHAESLDEAAFSQLCEGWRR